MGGVVRARLGERGQRGHVIGVAVEGIERRFHRGPRDSSSVNILAARCSATGTCRSPARTACVSSRYSSVTSKDCRDAPSISAARPARVRSRMSSRRPKPASGAPSMASEPPPHSENDVRNAAAVDAVELVARDAGGIGRNEKQRDAFAFARRARHTAATTRDLRIRRPARRSFCRSTSRRDHYARPSWRSDPARDEIPHPRQSRRGLCR